MMMIIIIIIIHIYDAPSRSVYKDRKYAEQI